MYILGNVSNLLHGETVMMCRRNSKRNLKNGHLTACGMFSVTHPTFDEKTTSFTANHIIRTLLGVEPYPGEIYLLSHFDIHCNFGLEKSLVYYWLLVL